MFSLSYKQFHTQLFYFIQCGQAILVTLVVYFIGNPSLNARKHMYERQKCMDHQYTYNL